MVMSTGRDDQRMLHDSGRTRRELLVQIPRSLSLAPSQKPQNKSTQKQAPKS